MSMAAMSPSQQALYELFESQPQLIGGRKVADAADPAIRRDMENSALAKAGGGDGVLNHRLDAVCRELRCSHAREGITTVLLKGSSE